MNAIKRKQGQWSRARVVTLLGFILLGYGSYIGIVNWRSNHRATTLIYTGKPIKPPNVVKPTVVTMNSYTVAPLEARYITIPKLNVNARVITVGVNSEDDIGTPSNVYDTARYDKSSLPGQPGAMLIDGHVASGATKGVFYNLKDLVPGDIIKVQRGDGKNFTYAVVKTQVYSASNVDMQALLNSFDPKGPGLNLITCTGVVPPGAHFYNERFVVFSTLQN